MKNIYLSHEYVRIKYSDSYDETLKQLIAKKHFSLVFKVIISQKTIIVRVFFRKKIYCHFTYLKLLFCFDTLS